MTPSRYINNQAFRRGRKGLGNMPFTDSEPLTLCYYFYCLLEDFPSCKVMDQYYEVVSCLIDCAEKLGKKERLTQVLRTEIKSLERKKRLIRLTKKSEGRRGYCRFVYEYEDDENVDRLVRNYDHATEDIINLARIANAYEKPVISTIINTVFFKETKSVKLTENFTLTKKLESIVTDTSLTKFLVDQIGLSLVEARYILLQYRCRVNRALYDIKRNSDNHCFSKSLMADLLCISEKEYRDMLKSDQKIKTYGFLLEDGEINLNLASCIEEQSMEPYFTDLVKTYDCSKAYELDSFSVNQESVEICLDLLKGKNPVSILFYGKPGAGKTELAKALCKQTGKKVYLFKNTAEVENCVHTVCSLACFLSMKHKDSILIVDEADSMLATMQFSFFGTVPTRTKGTVNMMLQNNNDKVIYIINHQQQIDESTLRRFTFSIKFDSMPASTLRSIAESKFEPLKISSKAKTEIVDMLDKYHLTGASVDNLVKTIEGIQCKNEEALLKKAQIVMKENSLLINGKSKMRENVKAEYDPSVLNASMNPLQIVEMVQNAAKFSEQNRGTENGIRMLFYGLSGTGKTELARYISGQLGKSILLKRASDILGKFVGENEENIRNAFSQAESSGSILLFDEADTFFSDRSTAHTSWERSMVNEFLTQMEEFTGILICTTNLRNIMDPAMQRRFHILVEFKPMKLEGIKTMAEKYFPGYQLTDRQLEELENKNSVTPGDFGALSSRMRFMNPSDINSDYVMEELLKIQIEKKKQWNGESERRIGFAG